MAPPDGSDAVEIAADTLTSIDPETLVWTDGLSDWTPARSLFASHLDGQESADPRVLHSRPGVKNTGS